MSYWTAFKNDKTAYFLAYFHFVLPDILGHALSTILILPTLLVTSKTSVLYY